MLLSHILHGKKSHEISDMSSITYTHYTARDTEPYMNHLMMLRVRFLMDYPYLCMSSLAEERATWQSTTRLCIARHKDRIIGLAIGVALEDYNVVQENFNAGALFAHYLKDALPSYFIMSEIYVEPTYRCHGIGTRLIDELCTILKQDQRYTACCLLNLERNEAHPLYEDNEHKLTNLWKRCNYIPTEMTVIWPWPIRMVGTHGEYMEMCENRMRLWNRDLR